MIPCESLYKALFNNFHPHCQVQPAFYGFTMPDMLDIDKEAGLVFDTTKWIECGQTYKDVPIYVYQDSSNIAAVSNIGMQLFEHMYGREF